MQIGGDADAAVLDGEAGHAVAPAHGHADRFALTVLHRVGQQVGDHLLDAQPIPAPRHRRRRHQIDGTVGARELLGHARQHVVHHLGQIHRLALDGQLAGANLGHVEEIAHQPRQPPGLAHAHDDVLRQARSIDRRTT